MTVAICINCGTQKDGSFARCSRCDFAPVSDEELVYSLAFSDHNFSVDRLAEIGAGIARTGTCPPLSAEQEAAFRKEVGAYPLKKIIVADNMETNEAAAAKRSIPADAHAHLQNLPQLIFSLIAGADEEVDSKELGAFKNLLRIPVCRDTFNSALFKSLIYFRPAAAQGKKKQKLTDAYLTKARSILDAHLSPQEFEKFRKDVLTFGSIIAAASGGVLGFGSKISNQEKAAIKLLETYFADQAAGSEEYSPVLSAMTEPWMRKFDETMFESFGFRPSVVHIGVYISSVQDFAGRIALSKAAYVIERGEIVHRTAALVGLSPDEFNALMSKQAPRYARLTHRALKAISANDKTTAESALTQLAWELYDKCYRHSPSGRMMQLISILSTAMIEFTFETLARLKSRA